MKVVMTRMSFLDDMLSTKFYESSEAIKVDPHLELSDPHLDVRSIVEITSDEQNKKDDENDEVLENGEEEVAFIKSCENAQSDDKTDITGTSSSSGLGLMNILASNVESPEDVVLLSVVREDFDILQTFRSPLQRKTPRIVELPDDHQIGVVEDTSESTDNNVETLKDETRTKESNVLTIEKSSEFTSKTDEQRDKCTKDKSETYELSMQVKDVFGEQLEELKEEHSTDNENED